MEGFDYAKIRGETPGKWTLNETTPSASWRRGVEYYISFISILNLFRLFNCSNVLLLVIQRIQPLAQCNLCMYYFNIN